MGTRADRKSIDTLQAEILTLRATQREAQDSLRGAEEAQVEALVLEQRAQTQLNAARCVAVDARALVERCAKDIGDRQDALAMIPQPRQP